MPDMEKAARFEAFARMRLEGRSDIVYRAYDLLTSDREETTLMRYMQQAGLYVPHGQTHMILTDLQKRFISWGFKVLTLGEIETLLHEFWVYQRIRWFGKKNWPYRDPDVARRMYEENEKARGVY